MEKGFNLVVVETKQNILEALNNSMLPITVQQMLLKEILNVINTQVPLILEQEQLQYNKSLEEENKNDNN